MGTIYRLENPGHPGGYVRRNIIAPRNLTVMDAAGVIDVTRQSLADFLNEKVGLTAELALRVEAAFGVEAEMLMDMQSRFDIAEARKRHHTLRSDLAKAGSHWPVGGSPEPAAEVRTIVKRGPAEM
jgi:antitoxin HigA-1